MYFYNNDALNIDFSFQFTITNNLFNFTIS